MQNQQNQKANNVQNAKQNNVGAPNMQNAKQNPVDGSNVHNKQNQNNMPKQPYAQPTIARKKTSRREMARLQNLQTKISLLFPEVECTPLSITHQMRARYIVAKCFKKLWSSKKRVNVIAVSFTVKDRIHKLERDRVVKSILHKVHMSINQNIGSTKCFWIRRNQVSLNVDVPVYTVIFMNNLSSDYHPWQKYSSIITQHFLQNADSCVGSVLIHTPPDCSTPRFMEISERLSNYATGENWVNELTEDLDPGFVIVKFGLIFEKFPKNSRKFLKSSAGVSARK